MTSAPVQSSRCHPLPPLQVQVSELELQASKLAEQDMRAAEILDEQLTAMLTKIDGVETLGRPNLRAVRILLEMLLKLRNGTAVLLKCLLLRAFAFICAVRVNPMHAPRPGRNSCSVAKQPAN